MEPIISIIHDTRVPNKDGKFPIKVRVTFRFVEGKKTKFVRKYYGKGFFCSVKEYATFSNPRSLDMREIKLRVSELYSSIVSKIKKNPGVSVEVFENLLFGIASDTVVGAFDKRVLALTESERIGSARVMENALSSLVAFATKELRFPDITPEWLTAYEESMLKAGKSYNTIGMYLRSLRAIFNDAIHRRVVPAEMYPFREFRIKSERKFKIPLNDKELALVKAHRPKAAEAAKAIAFWKFSYYCNGMNFLDIAKLKLSDIQDEFLIYDRSKTRNTKISFKKIIIPLDHEILAIIKKYGTRTLNPEGYIFPILEPDLPPSTVKHRVHKFVRDTNVELQKIASDLKIKKRLTTVIARHTFANRMSNGGADRRMIQESLGHQNASTTEHYLGTMEIAKVKKAREAL